MPTNKLPGIDQILMRVIKDSVTVILITVNSIINTSLLTGLECGCSHAYSERCRLRTNKQQQIHFAYANFIRGM